MKIEYYRTLWGLTKPLKGYLEDLPSRGFKGIETSLIFHSPDELLIIKSSNLKLILLILTFGNTVKEHLENLHEQLKNCMSFNPVKINIHGGCDYWNDLEIEQYFNKVIEYQNEFKIPIIHETHRSRILYNPFITKKILQKYPTLSITADLSHWVLVCERHLNTPEFKDIMILVNQRTEHIHARPSTTQSIQLDHIFDSTFKQDLDCFKKYWFGILEEKKKFPYGAVKPNSGGVLSRDLEECVDDVVLVINGLLTEING
jgi:hypothetical protein